jgi:hypothetical protein
MRQREELSDDPRPTRVYISGPMRGLPDLNKDAFAEAQRQLYNQGYEAINPHDLDQAGDQPVDYAKRDLAILLTCDAIYMLPGWQQSIGARAEYAAAIFGELQIMNPPNDRKDYPVARGLLDYFPDACKAVAHVSKVANDQHNPGEEMHWDKSKSTDHADCLLRHLIERGTRDTDGLRHTAKVAWRAMALLQTEIEDGLS